MGPWPATSNAYSCTSREASVLSAWLWLPARSGDPAASDLCQPLLVPLFEPADPLPTGGLVSPAP